MPNYLNLIYFQSRCITTVKSSRMQVFCHKKGALKNFKKSTRKHLCWSLFSDIIAGIRQSVKNILQKSHIFIFRELRLITILFYFARWGEKQGSVYKSVSGVGFSSFRFCSVFINVCIFAQQKAWTLWF